MKLKDDNTKTNDAFRKNTKSGGVQNSKRSCTKDLLNRQTKIHGDASDAVYSSDKNASWRSVYIKFFVIYLYVYFYTQFQKS